MLHILWLRLKPKPYSKGNVKLLTLRSGHSKMKLVFLPGLSHRFLMMRERREMLLMISLKRIPLSKCDHLHSSKDNTASLHLTILIPIFSKCIKGSRLILMVSFKAWCHMSMTGLITCNPHLMVNSLICMIDLPLLTLSWMGFINSSMIFVLIFNLLCMIQLWAEWTTCNKAFKIIWELCPANLNLYLPVTAFTHWMKDNINFRMISVSSHQYLTILALTFTICILVLHLVFNDVPFVEIDAKGGEKWWFRGNLLYLCFMLYATKSLCYFERSDDLGGACCIYSGGACCIYVLCFMLLSHYATLNYVWIFFIF
jgi:hypothetical protein